MKVTQNPVMVSYVCLTLIAAVNTATLTRNDVKQKEKYTDCHAMWKAGERKAGVYDIYPNTTTPVQVYCNHTARASFTVIQRRMDSSTSFYRGWQDYKKGFGNAQGNYWAGLDLIHYLTNTGSMSLRIDMTDWYGNSRYIVYPYFNVQDESKFYQMYVATPSAGNVADDLSFNNGMRFATFDYYDPNQCAVNQKAGWWYNYCSYALPNGVYYYGGPYTPSSSFYDGIYWKDWLGYGYSLKFITMSLYKQ